MDCERFTKRITLNLMIADDPILIDLLLAWNWNYDQGFVRLLDRACWERGLSFLAISPNNLSISMERFAAFPFICNAYLDRASESDGRFLPLTHWAQSHSKLCINPNGNAVHASDKAAVHYDLIKAGLITPYTIVLPPFNSIPDISSIDLTPLGMPFVAKPSHGGGSEGVTTDVWNYDQIQQARQHLPEDAFLLQSRIKPAIIETKAAWFRSIYCLGEVFTSWWDVETHVYTPLKKHSLSQNCEGEIESVSQLIAGTLKMDLFSTEIAYTNEGNFVVVDYLNDPIDLRLQSEAVDGVPDGHVERIAMLLAEAALDQSVSDSIVNEVLD